MRRIDAMYCYKQSDVVCLSVCLFVTPLSENGWTDRDFVVERNPIGLGPSGDYD